MIVINLFIEINTWTDHIFGQDKDWIYCFPNLPLSVNIHTGNTQIRIEMYIHGETNFYIHVRLRTSFDFPCFHSSSRATSLGVWFKIYVYAHLKSWAVTPLKPFSTFTEGFVLMVLATDLLCTITKYSVITQNNRFLNTGHCQAGYMYFHIGFVFT